MDRDALLLAFFGRLSLSGQCSPLRAARPRGAPLRHANFVGATLVVAPRWRINKGSKNEPLMASHRRVELRSWVGAKGHENVAKNGARDGARTRDLRRDRPNENRTGSAVFPTFQRQGNGRVSPEVGTSLAGVGAARVPAIGELTQLFPDHRRRASMPLEILASTSSRRDLRRLGERGSGCHGP